MLKVGLTGSIAVGKSYVGEVFTSLGCPVLDADQTSREVVKPDSKGWERIIENFGSEILQPNREINRAKLGEIVFADEARRKLLNDLIHPLVIQAQNEWLNSLEKAGRTKIAMIDAALMIESGGYQRFEKIIVVWCREEVQIERLMQRNNFSREEAERRIKSQMSQEEKKKFADYLIDTTEGFEETYQQTVKIYEQLSLL